MQPGPLCHRLLTALGLTLLAASPLAGEAIRLATPAFGANAQVEVRDLERDAATAAARGALGEIFELDRLFAADSDLPGSLAALNLAAGLGPQRLDPRAAELLRRSLQFCIWSSNAYGPLGGEVYQLWADRQESRRPPEPQALRTALRGAECTRLGFGGTPEELTIQLSPGSRVEALGIARGVAVDRALEVLRAAGVTNAWVEIGSVVGALGEGPSGQGWLASLPPLPGEDTPLDQIWLRDQAMAIVGIDIPPALPLLDQRTGVPARGVMRVVTVTEVAADAQGLATSLFVVGMRDGQMRLGALEPRPAVYWLLGDGNGMPLESTYNWSNLERARPER